MSAETAPTKPEEKKVEMKVQGSSETVYGLGLIGAWVYYIRGAATPQEKFMGFLKGFAWPAILVYQMLKFFEKPAAE